MATMDLELTCTVTGWPALRVLLAAVSYRTKPDNPDRQKELFEAVDAMAPYEIDDLLKLRVSARTPE